MGERETNGAAEHNVVVPDASRGRFLRSAEREAVRLAEQRRLHDLWGRAARREILLTDIPEGDRWAVRTLHATGWEWSSDGVTTVFWPAGHVDPFAGREDDVYIGPEVRVCFEDESPDAQTDPDGWLAFWLGCGDEPMGLGIHDAPDAAAGDDARTGDDAAARRNGEDGTGVAPEGELRQRGRAALPASAFPAGMEIPLALPRAEADLPAVVDQAPVSATHRLVGRWLGAPVSDLRWTKVAAGPDGSVWQSLVADDEVRRYDATGRLIDRYGGPGDGRTRFRAPLGLAVHPDGSVFVADNEHSRVQRIAPDGSVAPDWFDLEPPPNGVVEDGVIVGAVDPVDVAISPDGQEILVLDFGWRMLLRFDADGADRFPDREPERTNKATSLSVSADGERVYFLRSRGADVEWASEIDDAVWQPPESMEGSRFRDIEAAPDGTLYLLDEDHSCLHWLDPDGVVLETIPVGQKICEERDRVGSFLFAPPVACAAPTGVAAARLGEVIRVYVTLRDGAILAFEREGWADSGAR